MTTLNRIYYTTYSPSTRCYYNRHIDIRWTKKLNYDEAQQYLERHLGCNYIVTEIHSLTND